MQKAPRIGFLMLLAAGLLLPRAVCAAGFSISGATVTLSDAAEFSTIGDLIISSGSLVANQSKVIVGGNWNNSGQFTAGTSTVIFNGAAPQTVANAGQAFDTLIDSNTTSGGLTFTSSASIHFFTVNGAALAGATTIYFAAGSTFTVTVLTLTGASDQMIALRSTNSPNPWFLNNTASNNVSFVDAMDSDARQGIAITCTNNCFNAGNNLNWDFGPPGAPTIDAVYLSTITASWTAAPMMTVGYELDASSTNFDGTGVVYSSITTSPGLTTLTVGSAVALQPNTTYYLRAGALYGGTTSYNATKPSTSTLASALSNIMIYQVNATSITVNWTAFGSGSGANTSKGYELVASSTNFNGTGTVHFSSNTMPTPSTLTVQGLSEGTVYNLRAGAKNHLGVTHFVTAGSTRTGGLISTVGSGDWYSTTPGVPWPGGIVPSSDDTITISASSVLTASAPITVASMTVAGTLLLDGAAQAVTITVNGGGKLINQGVVQILSSAQPVTLQGGGSGALMEGTDIDFNGKKLFLKNVDYRPAMTLSSGETLELSGPCTFYTMTLQSGSSFVQGNGHDLYLTGDTVWASGTFTPDTGSGRAHLVGDFTLDSANQNLGHVVVGRSPDTITLASDLTATSLVINSGDVLNTKGYDLTITTDVVINGTLNATDSGPGNEGDGSRITLQKDWTQGVGSLFTAAGSTVVFSGSAYASRIQTQGQSFATIIASNTNTGGVTFHSSFTATNFLSQNLAASSTLYFNAGSTVTITAQFTLTGSAGRYIALRSTTAAAAWYLDLRPGVVQSVSYVDVRDSHADPQPDSRWISPLNALPRTNNTHWNFGAPAAPVNLAQVRQADLSNIPVGSTSTVNVFLATFTISDADTSDTLTPKVEIQPIGSPFTGIPNFSAMPLAYTGTPLVATVTLSGLSSITGYHWQAMTMDLAESSSSWTSFGANAEAESDLYVNSLPPDAVSGMTVEQVAQATSSSLLLRWDAPGNDGASGTLPAGSQFAIHYASYTVAWSTSDVNDASNSSFHIYITTEGVNPGDPQTYLIGGLNPNDTYYFHLWTQDEAGHWSADSNEPSEYPIAFIYPQRARFYLHARDVSEENATYNPMLPSVLPEGDTASLGTDDSVVNFTVPPCEANGFDLDTTARVGEEVANVERCVATFYSPVFGNSVQFNTSDLNSIHYSLWAVEEGTATTPVLRARLYEYVEGAGTFNLISTSSSTAVTAAGPNPTNYSWTAAPDSNLTLAAGNRLALVITVPIGAVPDGAAGTATIDVYFDRPVGSPAYVEFSELLYESSSKPVFHDTRDDDFLDPASCEGTCNGATLLSNPTWTVSTSGGTTTESVWISTGTGSSEGLLSVVDVKTANDAGTTLANYTYVYQAAPTTDGDITTSVLSSNNRTPTTNPRNLAGLVLRFSADNNFLILQSYWDGVGESVRINNIGVLGSSTAITGNSNNLQLRWTKTGTSYQAKFCAPNTTDCTQSGNWTNLGAPISKVGVTLDRVGMTSYVRWITGTNSQYGATFDWFTIHTVPPGQTTTLAAQTVQGSTTTLQLTWNAVGEDGLTGALGLGSQFAIQYATYTVAWSTSNVNDAVQHSTHVYISTSGVNPGDPQSHLLTGLSNGTTYFLTLWTKDIEGNWSVPSSPIQGLVYFDRLRIWTGGGGNALWSNAQNWNPTEVPLPLDHIYFDGTSSANSTLDAATVISTLTVASGYTGTFTGNNALTVLRDVSLAGGQYTMGSSSWTVGGNWTNTGASFAVGTSTVVFNGSTPGKSISGVAANFYTLVFNGAGADWTTSITSITVARDLNVQAGTFTLVNVSSALIQGAVAVGGSGRWVISSSVSVQGGSISNSGAILTQSAGLNLFLNGAGSLGGSGSTVLPALHLTGPAQTTTLAGPVTVFGDFSNASTHVLDAGSSGHYAMTVGGSWQNAGQFLAQSNQVTLNGSASGEVLQTNGDPFYALTFNGSGDWLAALNPVTVDSDLAITAGQLQIANASTMTVRGNVSVGASGALLFHSDLQIDGGDFTNAGTVSSLSTATLRLSGDGYFGGSGTTQLPKLLLSGNGLNTTLAGDISVTGALVNSAGHTLDANDSGDYALTISSDFANAGDFLAQAGDVIFTGTSTLTGQTTFYNFTATTPGITLTLPAGSTQTVTGALTLAGAGANYVKLRSSPNNQQHFLRVTGTHDVSAASIKDSNASGNPLSAAASENLLNNTNWTFGTPRAWVGGTSAAWSEPLNWNPVGVPGSNDAVTFNNAADCTVDIATTVARVTIEVAYSSAITANQNLTITGSYSQAGGTFNAGSTTLSIGKSWDVTGGTFNPGTGTVILTAGSSGQTIKTNNKPFYNLTLNGSGGYWTMQDSMTVLSSMTITAGSLDTGSSSWGISVTRDWLNTGGAFVANQSTVTLTGSASGKTIRPGSSPFWRLAVSGSGAWSTSTEPVNVSSAVALSAGTLTIASGSTMTVTGNVAVSVGAQLTINADLGIFGGTLSNAGTVGSAASAQLTVTGNGTLGGSGATVLPRVNLNGSGQTTTLAGPVVIQGLLSNGTGHALDVSGSNYAITVSSSWANSGTFSAQAGSVTFNGSNTGLTINPGSSMFYKLAFTGSGSWQTLTNPVTVANTVVINAGTFTVASGSTLTVVSTMDVKSGATLAINADMSVLGGSFTNAGTVTSNPSAVLTSSGTGTLGGAGSTLLPIVNLAGSAQTTTLGGAVVVQGNLTNASGHTLDADNTGNYALTVGGNWANSGTYQARASSVTFNGSGVGLTINPGSSTFYKLAFTGSGSWQTLTNPVTVGNTVVINAGTFTVASGSTLTVSGSVDVKSGATLAINADMSALGGSLTNAGTITSNPAAVLTSSGTGTVGGAGSTSLPVWSLTGSAQTTTLGGAVVVQGNLTNASGHTLDADNTGNYALTVGGSWANSGTYQARASSVTFNGSGGGLTINPGSSSFYRLIVTGPGSYQTSTNQVTVLNDASVTGGQLTVIAPSTMTVLGDVDVQLGATLSISTHMAVVGGSLTNAGTISSVNTSTLTLSGTGTLGGTGTSTLPQLVLSGNGEITTLGGDVVVQGQMTNTVGHTLDVNSTPGTYQITLSSAWTNAGTFVERTGTVVFTSTASLSGETTFYNFRATTPGITLTFPTNLTQTVLGSLLLTGAGGDLIKLRQSQVGATYFYLKSLGGHDISYVDVSSSTASGDTLMASASTGAVTVNWTFGNVVTWTGLGANNNWSTPANWSSNPLAPGALDSVVFNANTPRNCTVNITTTVAQLSLLTGNADTITLGAFPLTVTGNVSIVAGILTMGAGTMNVGGSWTKTGGTFNSQTSMVLFDANSPQTINPGGSTFNNVTFNGTGGAWTLQAAVSVATLTLNAGTFDANAAGNYGITVRNSWFNTGGDFTPRQSTVTFTATSAGHQITSGGKAFGHVTFNGVNGVWTLQDVMPVGNLTMTNGTLDTNNLGNLPITMTGNAVWTGGTVTLNASSVTAQGNWTRTATAFNLGTSTIAFTGSGNKTISTGGGAFYNLMIDGAGGAWSTVGSSVNVQNAFTVQTGTLTLANISSMTVSGSAAVGVGGYWVINSSAVVNGGSLTNAGVIRTDYSTPTVTLAGTGTFGGPGSTTLSQLLLNGNAQTTTLSGDVTLSSRAAVGAGHIFDGGSGRLTLTGSGTPFSVGGTFVGSVSTVTYAPSAAASVTVASTTFGNVQFNKSGATFLLSGMTSAAGQLSITAGTLNATASNWPLTVGGHWTNSDTFTAQSGSVTFNGSSSGLTINPGSSSFYKLAFTGSGGWQTSTNQVIASSDVVINAGSLTVASGSTMTVAGTLDVKTGATLNINTDVGVQGGSLTNAGTIASNPSATLSLRGTGTLGGSGSTILPILSLTGSGQTSTLGGPITIQGLFTNASGHVLDVSAGSNYAITASSSWANSGTFSAQSGSVTFNGSSLGLTINPGSSSFYKMAFTGSGGWQTSTNQVIVSSSVVVNAGTLTVASGSTMTIAGTMDVKSGALLNINADLGVQGGSLTNAGTIANTPSATLSLAGAGVLGGTGTNAFPRVLLSGNGQTTALGGAAIFAGLLSIGSGHTLDTGAGNNFGITISSSWANTGTFEPQTGEVTFTADATLSGNATFYNFTATTPGITLTFAVGSTQTVTGALTFSGASGNTIKLRSSTPSQQFFLNSTGSHAITFANVKDSNASGNTLNASASTNAGGNTNWTFGTNYVWVGPGNFSDATKWNPNGNPGPLDSVRFANANDCAVDISTTLTRATVDATYSGIITQNEDLVLSADFNQAGGTWNAGDQTLTIGASWNRTGGVFNAQTSTVVFNSGSIGRTVQTNNASFHNVVFNGPGGYWTMLDSMTVVSSVTLAAGTLDTGASGHFGISVAKDWINSGAAFAANASTVTFISNSSGRQIRSGGSPFAHLNFNGSGSWTPVTEPLTTTGNVTLNTGTTLTVTGASTMTVSGSMDVKSGSTLNIDANLGISGGTLSNAGTVSASAGVTLSLSGTGNLGGAGSTNLSKLNLTGNAQTTTLAGPVVIQDLLTNGSGHTLDANNSGNYAITVSSSWANAGTYTARTSSVTFNGSSAGLTLNSGGSSFYRLLFAGSGSYQTTGGLVAVSSHASITAGSLTVASGSSMTVTGNVDIQSGATLTLQADLGIQGGYFTNSGTFGFANGVTLHMSGTGSLTGSGSLVVPNLSLSGGSQTTTLANPIVVQGNLSNASGHTLDVSGSNYAITVSSSWANSGTFSAQAGSVTFNGSNTGLTINPGSSMFYKLAFTGSGSWQTLTNPVTVANTVVINAGTFTVASGSTLTVASTMDVKSGATLAINADMGVMGGTFSNAGTVTSNSAAVLTSSGTGTLGGAGSTLLPIVNFAGSAQTTTLGGAVVVQGNLTNASGHTLDADNTGNYALTVGGNWSNSGTYQARASSVTFNGSGGGLTINPGSSNFYRLIVTGPGSYQTSTNQVTVLDDVSVTGGQLTVIAPSTMTVLGDVDVQLGATLSISTHMAVAGGNLTNAGTISSVNTSTLTLSGTGTLGGAGISTLPQVVLSGNAQTTTLGGDITVQGQMTNTSGHTLDVNNTPGTYQMTVSSGWTNTGTFVERTGTVVFTSTASLSGETTFYNFTATTPGITLTFPTNLTQTVLGSLRLTGAGSNLIKLRQSQVGATYFYLRSLGGHDISYVDVSSSTASGDTLMASASTGAVTVNWTFGNVVTWTGLGANDNWNTALNWSSNPLVPGELDSVVFNANTPRNCVVNITTTVAQLSLLTGNADTITLGAFPLTVTGNVSIVAGILTMGAGTMRVGGSWTKTGGTYNANTSTVVFNANSTGQTINAGGSNFNNVTFDGSGGGWTLQSAVSAATITLNAGTLDANAAQNYGLTVRNSWFNTGGDFTPRQSTVTFTATSAGHQITSGGKAFGHVTFNGSNGVWTLQDAMPMQNLTLSTGTLNTNAAQNNPITVSGHAALNAGTLTLNASSMSVVGNWTTAALLSFNVGTSTVAFIGASGSSSTLTGSTTFYHLVSMVPGKTLLFQNAVTQVVNGKLTFTGALGNLLRLRSTSSPIVWFLKLNGTQNVGPVDVKDSNASPGSTIYAGQTSVNATGNTNWIFNYLPADITNFAAAAQPNGDVLLTWSAPLDSDDNPLGSGSQFAIQQATYSVVWSTSNTGDTSSTNTWHVYIATSNVAAGSSQSATVTGLTGNITYFFRVWTKDPLGYWSSGLSNGATVAVTPILSITLSTTSYNFGSVHVSSSVVSTTAFVVGNTGNVTQTYSLEIATSGSSAWTIAASTPTTFNQVAMFAAFHGVEPSSTTFGGSDLLTTTPLGSTSSRYTIDGSSTGVTTAVGTTRALWLLLQMPLKTSTIQPQEMTVTITAETP